MRCCVVAWQTVNGFFEILLIRVAVYLRAREVLMSQELLNYPGICGPHQVCRKGVPQRVRVDVPM